MPRKPHPMGNEYHTVACGVFGPLWAMEILEGRDRPPELGNSKYHEHGKTGSLLLRLSAAIFRTGKVIILDSGFCVSQAIITLMKFGACSSALMKKEGIGNAHQRS